jgi:hypothetical protein
MQHHALIRLLLLLLLHTSSYTNFKEGQSRKKMKRGVSAAADRKEKLRKLESATQRNERLEKHRKRTAEARNAKCHAQQEKEACKPESPELRAQRLAKQRLEMQKNRATLARKTELPGRKKERLKKQKNRVSEAHKTELPGTKKEQNVNRTNNDARKIESPERKKAQYGPFVEPTVRVDVDEAEDVEEMYNCDDHKHPHAKSRSSTAAPLVQGNTPPSGRGGGLGIKQTKVAVNPIDMASQESHGGTGGRTQARLHSF